jgi:hypothetical protein
VARPPKFENWLAHGWGIQVKTPHQLFRIISHIALLEQSRTYAWRGQNDASWDFSSSLFRRLATGGSTVTEKKVRDAELKILEEARRWDLGETLGPLPPTCTCSPCCSTVASRRV